MSVKLFPGCQWKALPLTKECAEGRCAICLGVCETNGCDICGEDEHHECAHHCHKALEDARRRAGLES